MKEIKITKTIEEVTGYTAEDGTRFYGANAKLECEKYENTAKAVINTMYKKIPKVESSEYGIFDYCGSEENPVDIIYIRNTNDVDVINKYLQINCGYTNCKMLDYDAVGTTQIILFSYDLEWQHFESVDSFISSFEKGLRCLEEKAKKLANGEEEIKS